MNLSSQDFSNIILSIQALFGLFTLIIAFFIGKRQNQINEKIGKLQDVVELHGALLVVTDNKDNSKQYVCIQNVGTRIIYLQEYIFNGSKYMLNGHILASTYSQTQANYYQIELPANGQKHISINILYKDIDGRLWQSEIICDFDSLLGWKIVPYPKKSIG